MKYIYLLLASVFGLLIFSSCGQDRANELEIENEVANETSKEVIINAYFYYVTGNGGVTTRSIVNIWKNKDEIGLFMKNAGTALDQSALANNVKLSTTGTNRFTYLEENKVYFPFNKQNVDFISYHPYTSSLDGLNYLIDVSNQNNLRAIDLLYSENATDKNSSIGEVDLTFSHQLTKVVFTILTNNSGKDLSGLTARISNVKTKATFSLINGTISDESEPNGVALNVSDSGKVLQAILLPDKDLTDNVLYITIGEIHYTYPLGSGQIKSFEKSTRCDYNINLEAANVKGVTTTITDWTVVSEDIEVTEDPSATIPESETPPVKPEEEGGGSLGSTEGEGGETGLPALGDGTDASPFNITQAIEIANSQVSREDVVKDVWIKGYIVGFYSRQGLSSFTNSVNQNLRPHIALAFSADETNFKKTFPVDITKNHYYTIFVSLTDNPLLFKKEVIFKGDITFLNAASSPDVDKHGMKNLSKIIKEDGTAHPK